MLFARAAVIGVTGEVEDLAFDRGFIRGSERRRENGHRADCGQIEESEFFHSNVLTNPKLRMFNHVSRSPELLRALTVFMILLNSRLRSDCTERREFRSSEISASAGSALISSSVTGRSKARSGTRSTHTQSPSLAVGSG